MTDQTWIVFFREAVDETKPDCFVMADQATIDPEIGEQLPIIAIFSAVLPEEMLADNGYPKDSAAEALNTAEELAFEKVDEGHCRLVARITEPGRRRWMLCHTLAAKLDMGRFAETMAAALGVKVETESAAWEEIFWVYPDRFEASDYWNWQIIASLNQNGDTLETPRPITHTMYDVDSSQEKALRQELEQYGYDIDDYSSERMTFSRVAPVDLEEINRETRALHLLSDRYDCGYDGWETKLVPYGRA